jgi:hypothetical protein
MLVSFAIENFALSCPELLLILFPSVGLQLRILHLRRTELLLVLFPAVRLQPREFFFPHFAIENFAFKYPGVLLAVTHVLAVEFSAVMI